jgi:hypothetical protein
VRGLIVGRLFFDPTLPVAAAPAMPTDIRPESSGATTGTTELTSLFAGRTAAPPPPWIRCGCASTSTTGCSSPPASSTCVGHRALLDPDRLPAHPQAQPAGRVRRPRRHHHGQAARPLGGDGWNFYAYGLLEDADPTPQVGNVAGAARAEVVLGTAELGAGALVRRGRKPRIGFDASIGVWDIDFYGELALRWGDEIDRVTVSTEPVPPEAILGGLPTVVEAMYPRVYRPGVKSQVVGGATYARKYNDNDVFNVGVEYFYNPLGYDNHEVYPGLVLPRPVPLQEPATFFYLGRHYGALFINFPAPYSWDYTSFTLSTLGNFSDHSFITRLDYALVMLTHLQFEAYAAVRYGNEEGEFRFGSRTCRSPVSPSIPRLPCSTWAWACA